MKKRGETQFEMDERQRLGPAHPASPASHLSSLGIENPGDPGPYQPGPEWDAKRTAFEQYSRKRNLVGWGPLT